MARFDELLGGCYRLPEMQASMERSMNEYPERIEDPNAATKTQWLLRSKPGTQAFAGLSVTPTITVTVNSGTIVESAATQAQLPGVTLYPCLSVSQIWMADASGNNQSQLSPNPLIHDTLFPAGNAPTQTQQGVYQLVPGSVSVPLSAHAGSPLLHSLTLVFTAFRNDGGGWIAADPGSTLDVSVTVVDTSGGSHTFHTAITVASNGTQSPTSITLDVNLGTDGTAPTFHVAAETTINERVFAVAAAGPGMAFFEVHPDGTSTCYGSVASDPRPQLCPSQTQVLLLSGGLGYVFDLKANTLTQITDPDFPIGCTKAASMDGYFIVLEPASQLFAISALNDGTDWDALDFGDAQGAPGNVVTMLADHAQLWFWGPQASVCYYNSGNANFPFTRIAGSQMAQGCAGVDAACSYDNSVAWLGRNPDGAGIVWRATGYTPTRISTHAVEAALQSYSRLDDCLMWTYQDGGHSFLVLHFPTANATWVYDRASNFWHERGLWNPVLGQYDADVARYHCYAWGKHLVGGPQLTGLCQMSQAIYSDCGSFIRRERVAPDLANNGDRVFYSELRLFCETGVGLPDNSNPQVMLQFSNDGGATWGKERWKSLGQIGQRRRVARFRGLGSTQDTRVFRIVYSEPTHFAIVGCDLETQTGMK